MIHKTKWFILAVFCSFVALASVVAIAQHGRISQVRATAIDGDNWYVHVNGMIVSKHKTERIASIRAVNEKLKNPKARVFYEHKYRVHIVSNYILPPKETQNQ